MLSCGILGTKKLAPANAGNIPEALAINLRWRLTTMCILPEGDQSTQAEGKICKRCDTWKPLAKFCICKGCKDGRANICRKCGVNPEAVKASDRRRYERHKDKIKVRVKAYRKKTADHQQEYHRNYYQKNAESKKAYQRDYVHANREKVTETKRRYASRDPERWKQYGKEYRVKNSEKLAVRARNYNEANRDALAAYRKAYFKANPHVKQINARNREARKKGAGGKFTPVQWRELCERYDNRCLCCGKQGKLAADHVIPLARGGGNDISNIQPLCTSCNSRKSTKVIDYRIPPEEFLKQFPGQEAL
jgi:5-methylcytosine-specific restriction endonuclease McrA